MTLVPLLSIMDLSKSKDRMVHLSFMGVTITVEDKSKNNTPPDLYNGFAQVQP